LTKEQHKIIKQYYRNIKRCFPVFNASEKRYLTGIQTLIEEFTFENPDFTSEALYQEIGEPKDIVSKYLLDIDAATLHKSLNRTRHIRIAAITIVSIFLITALIKFGLEYRTYLEAKEAYINREIIIIEE